VRRKDPAEPLAAGSFSALEAALRSNFARNRDLTAVSAMSRRFLEFH
jgi:hypothetical protein